MPFELSLGLKKVEMCIRDRWVLVCLANQTGVDLTAAVEANFAKKTARDRERHKENEKLK